MSVTGRCRALVVVAILVGSIALVPSSVAGAGTTAIDSCTILSEPGGYLLVSDIHRGGGTSLSKACIRITASDVVLYGNGHLIDGNGVSNTTGVAVRSPTRLRNVTVRNLRVQDWHKGVYYGNVTGGMVHNVDATNNSFGIVLERSNGIHVRASEVSGNIIGISVGGLSNHFTNNRVAGNHATNVRRELPPPDEIVGALLEFFLP